MAYFKLLQLATQESYGLQKPRRTSTWTITYISESGGSRLVLVLEKGQPEWRFFVEPPKDLPGNDTLRAMLEQPVAVGKIGDSLLDVVWRWRGPTKIEVPGSIVGEGPRVPSTWARNRMPGYEDHSQPHLLQVRIKEHNADKTLRSVEGTYELLPRCGTAFDSLYKRQHSLDEETDLYLFSDPDPTGTLESDSFVFSTSKKRLEGSETRLVDAWVAPSYSPWSVGHGEVVVKLDTYEWIDLELEQYVTPVTTNASWKSQPLGAVGVGGKQFCDHFGELIAFQVPTSSVIDQKLSGPSAWVAEAVRRELPLDVWTDYAPEDVPMCAICAPPKPPPVWNLGADGSTVERFEDPAMAADYEQSVKHRPRSAIVQIEGNNEPPAPKVNISLSLNLNTLAHRARAQLSSDVRDISYRWRLSSNATGNRRIALQSFQLKDTSDERLFGDKLAMTINLYPKQLQSLAWMKRQEQGQICEMEGMQDAVVPELDLRVEMRTTAGTVIRGGILADHPAFGKTVLSLALIQSQRQEQDPSDTMADLESRRPDNARDLYITAATLIVCPGTLVDQWLSEVEDIVQYEEGVIAIRTPGDLAKFTLDQFKEARVVIVSRNLFTSEGYATRLAAFAGIPGPVNLKGRAFKDWLAEATNRVPGHSNVLQRSGLNSLKQHVKSAYDAAMKSDAFIQSVPSRRLKGKAYMNAKQSKGKADTAKKPSTGTLDTSSVGRPLFEMFLWNRIIMDEFHKYEPHELAAITNLKGDKRWGLSATPRMADPYEVAQMGSLLGVDLAFGSMQRGIMKTSNIRDLHKQMTSFERFEAGLESPSDAGQARIHELLQDFLYKFVRRTLKPYNSGHLVPVKLDLTHQSLYSELSTQLVLQEMRVGNASKSKAAFTMTHREELHLSAVTGTSTAEEALSKVASYCSHETYEGRTGLEALTARRTKELEALRKEISKLVPLARRKESEYFALWRTDKIEKNGVGDKDVQALVEEICESKSTDAKTAKSKALDMDNVSDLEGGGKKQGKRIWMSKINELLGRLLTSKRSLRYVEAVHRVQSTGISHSPQLCEDPNCRSADGNGDVAVSAVCGHVVCLESYKDMAARGSAQCPVSGCSADMHGQNLLWRSKMADVETAKSPYGTKIAKAIDILLEILRRGDKAVLFVQTNDQLDVVRTALQVAGISATVPTGSSAARDIEAFKDGSNNKTVIVLNSSEETAVGLNLQIANHVLFLSPLLCEQQYAYGATMAQAVGRVDRPGQEKEISVYRIFAIDTIDVDILEHRERRTDALVELGAPAVQIPVAVKRSNEEVGGELKGERMQLVKDEHGKFSLRPQSWLLCSGEGPDDGGVQRPVKRGRHRVLGWEDFSTLVNFSRTYVEDDE